MNDEMMKKIMVFIWLLFAFAALGYVYQYGRSVKQTYPARSFMVDGDAKMALVPDIATFSVGVVSEGTKVPEVQKMEHRKNECSTSFSERSGCR